MSPTARWGGLILWFLAPGVWALGLGGIELDSALNQPLRAEILLVSATEEELSSLRVSLADQETFDRYGLDRPAFLEGIEFQLFGDAPGGAIVSVSSEQPIAEPFVTILVEANWSRGRILREYTVLLDPPVLLPVPSVAEALTPAQSGASAATQPAAAIDRPTPAPLTPVTTQPPAQTAPAPTQTAQPSAQPVTQPAATGATPASYGPVQSAETLWSIANRFRPAGVTMNQMMVAVFEANPQAFSGNMNTLHQGATLRLPQPAEFSNLSAAAATQEVQRQMALWEGGGEAQARLRLVTPEAATETSSGADSSAAGPAGAGFAGGTGGVDPSAADVAELEGELEALRAELDDSQALLDIRDQQLQELQDQLRAVSEQQAAAVTGAGTAIAPQPVASEAGVDLEEEPLFADEAATAEADAEPEPAVTVPPAVTQVVTTPEPSLISRVLGWLGNPLLWIGLGLLSLVGAAAWFLRYRQQDVEDVTGRWEALEADLSEEDVDAREATDRIRQQQDDDDTFRVEEEPALDLEPAVEAEPEFGADADDLDSSLMATTGVSAGDDEVPAETLTIGVPPSGAKPAADDTISSQTVINLEQADPIAEADFHMAYGLYDQAAELVEKALEAEPGRRDLTLKLLEVFFVWGNKDSFLTTAQVLHADIGSSGDSDWDKVVIMGKQICPDDALFSAAPASAGMVDVDLDAGDAAELDMSFDAEDDAGVDLDLGDLGGGDADLSLEPSSTMEQPPSDSLGDVDLDLDSGGGMEESSDDMLDIGLEASGTVEQASEDMLDFELEASRTVEQASEEALDLGDQTAAGLEAALIDPDLADEDAGSPTDIAEAEIEAALSELPDEFDDLPDAEPAAEAGDESESVIDDLAATQESPTVETPIDETETVIDELAATQESPTVETPMSDALDDTSVATDVIDDSTGSTGQMPAVEESVAAEAQDAEDRTAEIDLDDLGLDVEDLSDLTGDLSVLADAEDLESSDEDDTAIEEGGVLSSEDVAEVLQEDDAEPLGDDDAMLLATGSDDTNIITISDEDATLLAPRTSESAIMAIGDQDATLLASELSEDEATGITEKMEPLSAEDLGSGDLSDDVADALGTEAAELTDAAASIDLDLADLESALEDSDTVEQPIAQSVGSDLLGGGEAPDLNLDAGTGNDATAARPGMLDPHTMTMTEVGTKLDLARAYMDMGDPDGARSILEEVVEEGDENQQQEAKGLIDNL